MIVLGLTGSIGMGKSTALAALRRAGLPVHDADAAVHRLMEKGGEAVAAVEAVFPGAVRGGAVDRRELGRRVFGDAAALARLEAILHPLVRREEQRFLARCRRARAAMAVLDIPLLFETGAERACAATAVLSAPRFIQRARALARPGMTPARFAAIEARQMPDGEKRRRADRIVPTGLGRRESARALLRLVAGLRARRDR
jgi:dephospho-CoA kinase